MDFRNQNTAATQTPSRGVPIESAPSVTGEIEQNEKRLSGLHASIGILENKLAGVLRPTLAQIGPPGSGQGQGQAPQMPWSAVVCALKDSGFQVDAAIARIEDLLSRLDV